MNLKELLEQRNEKIVRMSEITEKCTAEKRAMTKEEISEFDKLEEECKGLSATIERVQKTLEDNVNDAPPEKKEKIEKEEAEKRAFVAFVRNKYFEEPEEVRTEASFTVTDNTAVIPSSIANKIIEEVKDRCEIYSYASKYNVGGDIYFPVYEEGIEMDYAEEFTDPTHTAGAFTSVKLTSFLARATTLISKSLINNSQFDLYTYIVGKVAQAVADWLEKELLMGTTDKIEGLSSVEASVTELSADGLINLQDSIKGVFQSNCRFIMSPGTKNTIRKFKDGQGNYLLERDYTTGTGNWTLLGRPVSITDALEDGTIFYGDYSGLAVKIVENPSIEVIREKYYEQHAVGLCAWLEMDAKVIEPQKIVKLVAAGE